MNRIIQSISAVFLGIVLLPLMCTSNVDPGQIGVRQSLSGGIGDEDFGPGRVMDIGFLHTLHTLPSGLHIQEFTGTDSLSVRTTQNNVIDVDLAVKYIIIPGEGHKIVQEGFKDTYNDKVASISRDFLQKRLAVLTNENIQDSNARIKVALSAIDPLNEQVAQYHVQVVPAGVVIRAIRFPTDYENKLQQNQLYKMQGKLDTAKKLESEAVQASDTVEKGIDKDVKLETETWNGSIQTAKTAVEIEIARVLADANAYDKTRRAEADALCDKAKADGDLAQTKAEALGKRLESEALTSPAGRTYAAVEAAKHFTLPGDLVLNTLDPDFLTKFGSIQSWRSFFLGQ